MALADYLRGEARKIAATVQDRILQVEADLAKAQELVGLLKTKVTAADNAIPKATSHLSSERQHEPDCPQCWMMEGEHVPLQPISAAQGATSPDTTDFWGCSHCGSVYGYVETPETVR